MSHAAPDALTLPQATPIRLCEQCGDAPAPGRYARFCERCRSSKRRKPAKYVSNEALDRMIARAYSERLDRKQSDIPGLAEIARRVGWPKWAILKRGRQLGLARTAEPDWSTAELDLLARVAWMSPERIRVKLAAAGFSRTASAIALKLKRTGAKQWGDGYNASGLAACFGCEVHAVTRWIRAGQLKAERRGEQANGQAAWYIREADVRRFVVEHPMAFTIRKVDQLWFMNLVTGGRLGETSRPGRREVEP